MTIFLVIFLVVFGVAVLLLDQHKRNKVLTLSPPRENLDHSTIYRLFYVDSGLSESQVTDLLNEIAQSVGLPAGKIRPTDIFGKDIGGGLITTEGLDELFDRGNKRAKSLGLSINFQSIHTVDDYIRAFLQKPPKEPECT